MMFKTIKKFRYIFIRLILVILLFACQNSIFENANNEGVNKILENGYYTNKEDVSSYLITYSHLPNNYITKNEAETFGWQSNKGNLWEVTHKKSIGGDRFYNREGLLPADNERVYFECDIDYEGGFRSAKRLVYSDDGYIYYTDDHYETFVLIIKGD